MERSEFRFFVPVVVCGCFSGGRSVYVQLLSPDIQHHLKQQLDLLWVGRLARGENVGGHGN